MKINHLTTIFLIAAVVAAASGCLSEKPKDTKPVEITFSAAVSLQDALKEIGAQFQKNHPEIKVNFNFGASGVLEKQIEQDASVDLFASASQKEIDLLEEKGLIIRLTRTNFTRNKLVIIAPSRLTIEELKNLDKIAIGDPKTVPAGRYAQTFMENAGIYEMTKPKLIFAENVRQVLDYVERGEVDAGFVYFSDTIKSNMSVSSINDSLYPPIVYPVAVINDSQQPAISRQFIEYLQSNEGQTILKKYGFG
ncbi:MAG: molybdate ABC transporter substrate-binding protein [Candidatus Methanoperedens sp.]|nr:molybdate ABC transporter substrate-binding protein [Candidatus Methanoperedens sp.]